MYKKIMIIAAILSVAALSAFAISSDCDPEPEIFAELHNQLKTYRTDNIIPQMNNWKSKIDNALSSEDLTSLNELRQQAGQLRIEHHQKMMQMHQGQGRGMGRGQGMGQHQGMGRGQGMGHGQGMGRNKSDQSMGQGRGMGRHQGMGRNQGMQGEDRQEMREIFSKLRDITAKYPELTEQISSEAMTYHDKWRDDTHDMIDAWREKYDSQLGDCPNREDRRANRESRRASNREGKDQRNGMRGAAMVFLYNGEDFDDFIPGMPHPRMFSENLHVKVFPNPFSDKATVEFFLGAEADVKVSVWDNSGNEIASLYNGKLSEGVHSFDFVTSDYSMTNGTYFYKIEVNGRSHTGKMIYSN